MTDWPALLADLDLSALGLSDTVPHLSNYLRLLSKWTATTNLVAPSVTPRDLVALHIADCLSLLPHLGAAERVVDVGSGGGLPAVVLAIARPSLRITALEPVHKKHAFLAAVRRELHLDNFTPLAERDDQHRARPDFLPYDLAVSRAAFSPSDWLPRGAALVRPGGLVVAMEGREQTPLPPGATRHPYHLANRDRAIITWPRP